MAIADVILKQLGGARRLSMFVGAKGFCSDDGGRTLIFKFPNKARSKPNRIKVTLTAMDDYIVEFGRIGRKKDKGYGLMVPTYKVLKTIEGVYCDQLMDIFETETGLYLTLSPRR